MRSIGRLCIVTTVSAALLATCAATASAARFVRCGSPLAGGPVSGNWAGAGTQRISISNRAAASIGRRVGPGVEGFHATLADDRCSVAVSVEAPATIAWAKSPRPSFSVGVRIVGAGRHPFLGRFRCTVVSAGRNEAGTCTHTADRHAARIVVKFKIDRVRA